jgi:hypothetical protein
MIAWVLTALVCVGTPGTKAYHCYSHHAEFRQPEHCWEAMWLEHDTWREMKRRPVKIMWIACGFRPAIYRATSSQ